jgi:ADP-heptose:LPS heptosyltransferase
VAPIIGGHERKVIVIRAVGPGEMLYAVPALRTLRKAMPQAEITLAGRADTARMARRYESYARFETFPGWPGLPGVRPELFAMAEFFSRAEAERYDVALLMQEDAASLQAALEFIGAQRTGGFGDGTGEGFMPYPRGRAAVLALLDLVEHLTGVRGSPEPEFDVTGDG